MTQANPFSHNPFDTGPPMPGPPMGVPPQGPPPAPGGSHGETNTLATLSVVFAFICAPVGLVLGYLGLSQIAQTGQRGRDRALVGVTLSYVAIVSAVVAVVVGVSLSGSTPAREAAAKPTHPAPATTTKPPAVVAAADLAGILPSLAEVRDLTSNPALTQGPEHDQMTMEGNTVDRPECVEVASTGAPDAYTQQDVTGYRDTQYRSIMDRANLNIVIISVTALRDAAAAKAQADGLVAGLRGCADSAVTVNYADGTSATVRGGTPVDTGNNITTAPIVPVGVPADAIRALAVKNNVVIDMTILGVGQIADHATAIVGAIYDKIPA